MKTRVFMTGVLLLLLIHVINCMNWRQTGDVTETGNDVTYVNRTAIDDVKEYKQTNSKKNGRKECKKTIVDVMPLFKEALEKENLSIEDFVIRNRKYTRWLKKILRKAFRDSKWKQMSEKDCERFEELVSQVLEPFMSKVIRDLKKMKERESRKENGKRGGKGLKTGRGKKNGKRGGKGRKTGRGKKRGGKGRKTGRGKENGKRGAKGRKHGRGNGKHQRE